MLGVTVAVICYDMLHAFVMVNSLYYVYFSFSDSVRKLFVVNVFLFVYNMVYCDLISCLYLRIEHGTRKN